MTVTFLERIRIREAVPDDLGQAVAVVRDAVNAADPVLTAALNSGASGPTPPSEVAVLRLGRYAWATVGIAAALVVGGYALSLARLAVVPLLLAMFPAAVLSPVSAWLQSRRMPASAAALTVMIGGAALFAAAIAALVPPIAAELPRLADAADRGVASLQGLFGQGPFRIRFTSFSGLAAAAVEKLNHQGDLVSRAMSAASTAAQVAAGVFVGLAALFFYLKDGARIVEALAGLLPRASVPHGREIADRIWWTVGAYFRGQLLIALVDATFIGLGLLALRVPLALPLAVIVFLGGLFPIIGAFVSGLLAVLVALAERGLGVAIAVVVVILVVQQLEGNILQPLIMSRATRLHPLVVLIALTVGAATFGVLGAFLAVPASASAARIGEYVRERRQPAPAPSPPRPEPAPIW
jgi:putative heme transporter